MTMTNLVLCTTVWPGLINGVRLIFENARNAFPFFPVASTRALTGESHGLNDLEARYGCGSAFNQSHYSPTRLPESAAQTRRRLSPTRLSILAGTQRPLESGAAGTHATSLRSGEQRGEEAAKRDRRKAASHVTKGHLSRGPPAPCLQRNSGKEILPSQTIAPKPASYRANCKESQLQSSAAVG